jgi:hypothetical protein
VTLVASPTATARSPKRFIVVDDRHPPFLTHHDLEGQ